jgi:hypothetical protein
MSESALSAPSAPSDKPNKFRDLFYYEEKIVSSTSYIMYRNVQLINNFFHNPQYNWLIMSTMNGYFYMWKDELKFDEKIYCFGADFVI